MALVRGASVLAILAHCHSSLGVGIASPHSGTCAQELTEGLCAEPSPQSPHRRSGVFGDDLEDASALQSASHRKGRLVVEGGGLPGGELSCSCPFVCADADARNVTGNQSSMIHNTSDVCLKLLNATFLGPINVTGRNTSLVIDGGSFAQGITMTSPSGHLCIMGDPDIARDIMVVGAGSVTICGGRHVAKDPSVAPGLTVEASGSVVLRSAPCSFGQVTLERVAGNVDILDSLSPTSAVSVTQVMDGYVSIKGSSGSQLDLTLGSLVISQLANASVTLESLRLTSVQVADVAGSQTTVRLAHCRGAQFGSAQFENVDNLTIEDLDDLGYLTVLQCGAASLTDMVNISVLTLEKNRHVALSGNKGDILKCDKNTDLVYSGCNTFHELLADCNVFTTVFTTCPP